MHDHISPLTNSDIKQIVRKRISAARTELVRAPGGDPEEQLIVEIARLRSLYSKVSGGTR